MVSRDTVLAASRFGLGPKPGELEHIGSDPRAWLAQQLKPFADRAVLDKGLPDSASALRAFFEARAIRRAAREDKAASPQIDPEALEKVQVQLRKTYRDEINARATAALSNEAPFRERLVHFWANHFTVSAQGKLVVAPVAAPFVREAIRPHVMGRFETLLLAVEQHPAMLLYLDNAQSVGPNSPAGRRRERGLNENLAREILELHTLGVDGGYTQGDVTTFAKVITGWTIGNARLHPDRVGAFVFEPRVHEPGAKTVLGRQYGQEGLGQGEAVLRDLAHNPATHRHLATKLARHFIADEPPTGAVERIARAFSAGDGDLTIVYRALIDEPEVWRAPLAKLKTPEEFLLSLLRGLDLDDVARYSLAEAYALLGQRPFLAPSPQGWPDTADAWSGPDAIKTRLDYADQVSRRVAETLNPTARARGLLGPLLSPRTADAVARAESAVQGLTLFLMSPEFQRR